MPDVAVSRDDITQIMFTSGATGEPKGVVIRHRNVMANIVPVEREVIKYRKYGRPFHPIRFLNLLPLSHMFGQAMATNVPPMIDGTVIFTRSLNPQDIIRLIRTRRVSVLVCVPKILDVLREYVTRAIPESAEAPAAGTSVPAAGGSTGVCTPHSASSSGPSLWVRLRSRRSSKNSGAAWASSSFRAMGSPKRRRS